MLKEILSPILFLYNIELDNIRQTDICCHGYRLSFGHNDKYQFCVAHSVPSLNLKASIIFELFAIMSSKSPQL